MVLTRGKATSAKGASAKSGPAAPAGKIRIGILLTYPKLEQKKEELVGEKWAKTVCPFLKDVDEKYVMERKCYKEKTKKSEDSRGRHGVPSDVAIGYYIKSIAKNVEVDLILPHEISLKRLQANHLNFLLIYDLLEAFHTDKSEGRETYGTLRKCLAKAGNIYPPLEYQDLVYSKIKYYNYMKENDVPIAPTLCMTAAEYRALGCDRAVKKVLDHVDAEKWGKFLTKPVYGQESTDVYFWTSGCKKRLASYLERCMAKYPGIVFQKAIPNFGHFGGTGGCPEIRMYFCNKRYKYSCFHTHRYRVTVPTSEGGQIKAPMSKLLPVCQSILKKLPKLVMPNGTELPRLLDRLDMGYNVDGRFAPFVNELEFVPSLYVENVAAPYVSDLIKELGKQMVHITKTYVKKQRPVKKRPVKRSTQRLGVIRHVKKSKK